MYGRDSSPSLRLSAPTPMPRHTPMPHDATVPASAVVPVSTLPETPSAKGGAAERGSRWMIPALIGVALIGGMIAFAVVKGGGQNEPEKKPAPAPAPAPAAVAPAPAPAPAPVPEPAPTPPPVVEAQPTPPPVVEPATAVETTPAHKKKPVTKKKRPKERPDDDPFGTLQ